MPDPCACKPPPHYNYYDTPEGYDIFKKTIVTSRYGLITGLIISTYDVLMYSHTTNLRLIARRYARHTGPLLLMGATFSVVSNGLVKLRGQNDKWNYVAGALTSAPILGWYLGSMHGWFLGSIALSAAALLKKSSVNNHWMFFPDKLPHSTSTVFGKRDFTVLSDPKNILDK